MPPAARCAGAKTRRKHDEGLKRDENTTSKNSYTRVKIMEHDEYSSKIRKYNGTGTEKLWNTDRVTALCVTLTSVAFFVFT